MYRSSSDHKPQANIMTLTGSAHVNATPDMVLIRMGVQTMGENLTEAQEENARLSQNVLQTLNQMGITNTQTFQYVIDKIYEWENGIRMDRGYTVRNIFEIRISNVEATGAVIDAAVGSGANLVEFISFEVSNTATYYRQALNLAIRDGIQKAKSISSNLGIPFNAIPIRITENSTIPLPFSQMFTAREGFNTPIEAGEKRIDALVTLEFKY
ncbi:MAG: SIMPL domain-containing protein [Clostridiales bacterium]|nr:SIMPL domain-containing protein [Clostridiales bacterium]